MMKLTLFALFCLEASLAATPSKAVLEDWEAWKQQHGKSYSTNSHTKAKLGELNEVNQEESFRMKVWMENKAAIEKHNKEFEEGVHTFSTITMESSLLRPVMLRPQTTESWLLATAMREERISG